MANTKISALPSYTGTAADLRWFVMNNSGETETYKFSGYTSQLIPGTGTDSYRTINSTGADGTNSIAIGKDTNAAGNGSVNIGNSYGNAIGTNSINIGNNPGLNSSPNQITIGSGAYNNNDLGIAIGHSTSSQQGGICIGSSTTRATGLHSVSLGNGIEQNLGAYSIMIGYNNSGYSPFNGNPYGVVIGSGHRVDNTGYYNTILGGLNNTLSGNTIGTTLIGVSGFTKPTGSYDVIIGGNGNNYDNSGYTNNISIGGESNVMTGTRGFKTIINGSNNQITGTAKWASIVGGRNNTIADGDYGMTIIGGESNYINTSAYGSAIIATASSTLTQAGTTLLGGGYSNSVSNSNDCVSIGGRSNSLTNQYNTGGSANIAGESNSLTGNLCAIVGGNNNTITGGTHQVMLGCSGRTATEERTTYVENLKVFGQAKYGNFNNGSRATNYTIDWNNGNIQKVVLTGSCVFSATNITDGTTYIFKVSQDNSGNRAATWSSGIFKFANSTPPTLSTGANAVDIFTFVAMDGLLYGVAQLNFG